MARAIRIKKFTAEEIDTEGSWAISYGDMITLLLSFFVMFFSFDFKKEREDLLIDNVIKNMSMALGDIGSSDKNGVVENETVQLEDLNEVTTIATEARKGKIIVFFKGANFFDSGKTQVNGEGEKFLKVFAKKYLPFAGKFRLKVQAFTDDKPVKLGHYRFKNNVELSALRSISVMQYLQKTGLPINQLEIGGKGIATKRALKLLGIKANNIDEIRKMSRTVAFVLYREVES